MDTISARSTDFYFRALFGFPEITGPRQIAMGISPPTYSLPQNPDLTCHWTITGGKLIPGTAGSSVRAVFLAEKEAKITVILDHMNGAGAEVNMAIELP